MFVIFVPRVRRFSSCPVTGTRGHVSCINVPSQCSGSLRSCASNPRARGNGLVWGVFLSMDHGLGGVIFLLLGVSSRIHQGKQEILPLLM